MSLGLKNPSPATTVSIFFLMIVSYGVWAWCSSLLAVNETYVAVSVKLLKLQVMCEKAFLRVVFSWEVDVCLLLVLF